ncbi:SPOSA6832_01291 [Sporobolomyces salmonicolor]|uniref:Fucosyltransferase n=1 Tax=Sporidiobolus salmonicolor TaxID=5005 RepID=A0A0D6EI89_SPOSA|nr:SPOSA6832_01291 [Sporobolomyces salmonicolor]
MAVDRDIKLDTFAYDPVDAAEEPSTDTIENRAAHADSTAGLEEEELAWQRPAKRRRAWGLPLAAFAAGAIAGAALLSIGHWWWNAAEPVKSDTPEFTFLDETTTTSAPSSFPDFLAVPPVRIHYRNEDGLNHRDPLLPPSCPVPVVYTTDESSADLVVFNSDSHSGLSDEELADRRRTRPWQKSVVWGVESAPNRQVLETHLNKLRDGRRNETYDYEMCYRLNSTVPATYSYSYFNYANPPVPRAEKRSDKIAAAFITNCHPKNARTRILEELIRLLPGKVDSFGACVNNANADATLREMGHFDDVGQHNKWNTKITVINFYKFTIAFENSNDLDYTTEKYFQALERGSVPLVFGSPAFAARFLPAPNAAIDVAAYLPANYTARSTPPPRALARGPRGLARLARRLEHLASDAGRDEYDAMLAWKADGRWRADGANPLGKIVRMATSEYAQDCKLAGVYRGEEWARSGWVEPPGR